MDTQFLTGIGLTQTQAKAYITLVQNGPTAPPVLAEKIGETRTNAYKVLDKLVELGLARKVEQDKKVVYRVENPVALEALARRKRDAALAHERKVKDALPALMNFFYTYSEQPGVRFYQGQEGIRQIFEDMLRTRQTIYLVRSPSDVKFYDEAFFERFRKQRAELGIETYAITPNVASAVHNADVDRMNKFSRTWIPASDYTANVEWDIYGDKVALISYGEEAIGMIIESPQIAASFRQMFMLVSDAAKV
jgi:sugar-specific transcriptional regulator TrmB